jgi:hypothetical protein
MSLPGCLVLKTRDGKVTSSLSKAVKKRSKNITAPMHNIASAIPMSSPACSSLQGFRIHWTTVYVRAGTRIHKEFVRAPPATTDVRRIAVAIAARQQPHSAWPGSA